MSYTAKLPLCRLHQTFSGKVVVSFPELQSGDHAGLPHSLLKIGKYEEQAMPRLKEGKRDVKLLKIDTILLVRERCFCELMLRGKHRCTCVATGVCIRNEKSTDLV